MFFYTTVVYLHRTKQQHHKLPQRMILDSKLLHLKEMWWVSQQCQSLVWYFTNMKSNNNWVVSVMSWKISYFCSQGIRSWTLLFIHYYLTFLVAALAANCRCTPVPLNQGGRDTLQIAAMIKDQWIHYCMYTDVLLMLWWPLLLFQWLQSFIHSEAQQRHGRPAVNRRWKRGYCFSPHLSVVLKLWLISMLDIQAPEILPAIRASLKPFQTFVIRVQVWSTECCLFQSEHTQSRKQIPSLLQLFL